MVYTQPIILHANLAEVEAIDAFCRSRNWSHSYFLRRAIYEALRHSNRTMAGKCIDTKIVDKMRRISFPHTATKNLREMLAKSIEPKQILDLVALYEKKSIEVYGSRKLRASFRALRKELSGTKRYEEIRSQAKQVAIMRSMNMVEQAFKDVRGRRE